MIRPLVIAACALLTCTSIASAQHPANHTPPVGSSHGADSTHAHLLGVWEGTFKSHGPSGEIRLEFTKDSVLRVRTEFVGQGFGNGASYLVTTDKNSLTWSQVLMEHECKTWAVLANGVLDGELSCGDVTFSVKKKGK